MALDSEHLRSLFGILSRWSRSSSELKITDTHRLGLSVLCDSPASGFRNQQEKIPQGETEPRPDTVTNGEAENRQHHSSWKVCHHLSQHLGRNPGGGGHTCTHILCVTRGPHTLELGTGRVFILLVTEL